MKIKRHPWGPYTIETKVEQEFVDILLEKGNESREKNLDNRKHLAGQIENEYYYKDYEPWFTPLFDPYVSKYYTGAHEEGLQFFSKPVVGYSMISLWINYQQANEYNPPHNHGGDLSFVLYLQVPEEIKQENKERKHEHNNPGPGMICFDLGPAMPFSCTRVGLMPEVGDLIIFPAWLQHHVNSFKADVERISVSGNLNWQRVEWEFGE